MISKLKGIIDELNNDHLIIDVNSVFYDVFCSKSVLTNLEKDKEIIIFIYDSIKEDSRILYGFLNNEDKELFKFLIKIRGVGEKTVMGWMSEISSDSLKKILHEGDIDSLCKLPKVGRKTGEKILADIKHSIKSLELPNIKKGDNAIEIKNNAVLVLSSLGVNKNTAEQKVKELYESGMNVSDLVSVSLKK